LEFEDPEISSLDLELPENVSHLIVRCLCGENHEPELLEEEKKLIAELMKNAKTTDMNHSQFNELLLLLNQDTVGGDFFKYFFRKEKIALDDLKKGIINFCGFAMLCFGNFRHAYKLLAHKSGDEIKEELLPYSRETPELIREFQDRPSKMLEISKIKKDKTWLVGELSGNKLNKEAKLLKQEIQKSKKGKSQFGGDELFKYGKRIIQNETDEKEVQEIARENTDIYLTWDYMDIYFATSMRNEWEFEETFDFIQEVFADPNLKKLNLRYFDPTQSKCGNPRDKGLIEGLMLKRAKCTIYLAQESDTMGKDSELAATLAQKKPVIAYVPKHDPKEYSKKIYDYPLDFFKKRFLILEAEEILTDPECTERLSKYDNMFLERIDDFLSRMDDHYSTQPFRLWIEKENEFKKHKDFQKICDILAIAECYNFDRRAILLRERHPLSLQVDLQSGVANGVLVVRNSKDCVELLHRILTNQLKFTINRIEYEDEVRKRKEGYSVLEEEISKSHFRVVTHQTKLTNSFWNLFP